MCVNKHCLYHNHHEDTLVFDKSVDDEVVAYDDNHEWTCVYKDCLYHKHILDDDDANDDDEVVINK